MLYLANNNNRCPSYRQVLMSLHIPAVVSRFSHRYSYIYRLYSHTNYTRHEYHSLVCHRLARGKWSCKDHIFLSRWESNPSHNTDYKKLAYQKNYKNWAQCNKIVVSYNLCLRRIYHAHKLLYILVKYRADYTGKRWHIFIGMLNVYIILQFRTRLNLV